jgi:DNA-binding LacI/PurR family transcriptional regulator
VVTAGLSYIGPSRTLSGITKQAETLGYSLLLKELPRFDSNDIEPTLHTLLARQVDGLIWAVSEVGSNHNWLLGRLPSLSTPLVFLTMHEQPNLSIAAIDNFAGGYMATEHLLKQGYQHIGHLAGPMAWWEARQRKAGWQAALTEAGLPAQEHHSIEGNWSAESGQRAISQLLNQYPEMDAVFVANDQMALSVMQVAHRQGLRVPQNLAVVGFDDLAESAYFWPPLTTIQQNLPELGCMAVSQLVRMIETAPGAEGHKPQTIWIKPQLIVRDSSVAR